MRYKRLFVLTLFLFNMPSFGADCLKLLESQQLTVNSVCRLSTSSLSPTQANVGFKAVESKFKKLIAKSRISQKKLKKYLKKKTIPVVLGSIFEGRRKTSQVAFYMIDGHHTMSALYKYNLTKAIGQKHKSYIKIISDARSLYFSEFWPFMLDRGLVYLKNKGEFITPLELPQKISGLTDDPYRSLAWEVRELGCFDNLDHIPFQEFKWADFLRSRSTYDNLRHASQLAVSDEAKELNLPGFKGFCSIDATDN